MARRMSPQQEAALELDKRVLDALEAPGVGGVTPFYIGQQLSVHNLHPTYGQIDHSLRRLRGRGLVKLAGRGRAARWQATTERVPAEPLGAQ